MAAQAVRALRKGKFNQTVSYKVCDVNMCVVIVTLLMVDVVRALVINCLTDKV